MITIREDMSKPYSGNNGVFLVKSGSDKRKTLHVKAVEDVSG